MLFPRTTEKSMEIGAVAGEIARDSPGLGETPGKLILCGAIILLVFFGTVLIKRVLAGWSSLLYAVYGVFITLYLLEYGAHLDLSQHGAPTPGAGGLVDERAAIPGL